ncbi:MAG: S41 family peptidase [Lachnospiraceae bacterium]|nr:S41 family peptidase [Lachnospiraceae bacterium]
MCERYEYGEEQPVVQPEETERDQKEAAPTGEDAGKRPPDRKPRKPRAKAGFLDGILVGILVSVSVALLVVGGVSVASLLRLRTDIGSSNSAQTSDEETDSGTSDSLQDSESEFNEELESKLAEINALIDSVFIFDVDEEQMMDSLLAGYLDGLDDDYSVYYTAEEYEEAMTDSDGSYVGIGVAVQQDTTTMAITVLTVYAGSPAEASGMEKGDILQAVDGTDITQEELSDVVNRIRGEEGTQVTVTVLRDGETLDLTMTRESLDKVTVEYEMLEDGIGYILLTEFDNVSVSQMEEAITALREQGMEKLILDLRDNPGGLLASVVSIADLFLPETNIFYSEDKQGNQTRYDSSAEQLCTEELVVLVNGNSASASEVLAGSLKDHGRATLVGTQTFGKGIVQTYYQLSDGSGIKLTTAHYFTPNGTDIHGIGIEPDLVVEDDGETEADEQLAAALEAIRGE